MVWSIFFTKIIRISKSIEIDQVSYTFSSTLITTTRLEPIMLHCLDLKQQQQNELKEICRKYLKEVEQNSVSRLATSLFPIKTTKNLYHLVFVNLQNFYGMKLMKGFQIQEIDKEVFKKAADINQKLKEQLLMLFKSQFYKRFKKIILRSHSNHVPKVQQKYTQLSNKNEEQQEVERKAIVFDNKLKKYNGSQNQTKSNLRKVTRDLSAQKSSVFSTGISRSSINIQGPLANLTDQDMCLCGRHVSLVETNKQSSLKCDHCQKRYHYQCMKRSAESRCCSFCHLRLLYPHKPVRKTLFLGLLRKQKKKHQINLYLNAEDLTVQFKIEVRCFRIRQDTQNIILFPDTSHFTIGRECVKQFLPINKSSSLKIRKDQPFYLTSGIYVKENKIYITQRNPKDSKNDRIQPQDHLLGIYLIQERRVESIVREIKLNSMTTFLDSKQLLEQAFVLNHSREQISCQVINISLTCSLTSQPIKFPARGIFCNHFQCFDLYNFLGLTSSSQYSKWVCPICKLPAYQFQIDCILRCIIDDANKGQEKQNLPNITQVCFKIGGDFEVKFQDQRVKSTVKNIDDLQISQKFKRVNQQPPKNRPKSKRNSSFQMESKQSVVVDQ